MVSSITAGICDQRNGDQGLVCTAAILSRSCPLWVKSRHHGASTQCPLYPQKRTLALTTLAYAYSGRARQLAIPSHGWLFVISAAPILSLPIESGCHGQPTNPSLKAVSTPAKRLCNWLKNHAACPPKADITQRNRDVRFVPKADIPANGNSLTICGTCWPDLRRVHRFGHSVEDGDALATAAC